jgi:hypothetical protein
VVLNRSLQNTPDAFGRAETIEQIVGWFETSKEYRNTRLSLANDGLDSTLILNHIGKLEITMDTYVSQKLGSVWHPCAPFAETGEGKVPRNPIMPGSSAPGAAFSRGVPAAADWQPPVDIVECESEFVIGVELIGIKRDQ